jgi:hypothetical protein
LRVRIHRINGSGNGSGAVWQPALPRGSVAKNAQVCGVDDIASLQPLQPCMPFGVDDDGPLIQVLFLEWVT